MGTDRRFIFRNSFLFICAGLLAYPGISQAESRYGLLPSKQLKIGQLGFQSKWESHWFQNKDTYLGGYWDASVSRALLRPTGHHKDFGPVAQDFGLTAVLRYQRNDGTGFYAEAGTGPQYQLASYYWTGRPQHNRLALNTLAGVGFVWKNGVDLGFKAVHFTRGEGANGGEAGSVVGVGVRYNW